MRASNKKAEISGSNMDSVWLGTNNIKLFKNGIRQLKKKYTREKREWTLI